MTGWASSGILVKLVILSSERLSHPIPNQYKKILSKFREDIRLLSALRVENKAPFVLLFYAGSQCLAIITQLSWAEIA